MALKGLRVRAASDALSAAGKSASGPSAARSSAGGCLRGGPKTGACVWSIVFGGCCGVWSARDFFPNDDDKKKIFSLLFWQRYKYFSPASYALT